MIDWSFKEKENFKFQSKKTNKKWVHEYYARNLNGTVWGIEFKLPQRKGEGITDIYQNFITCSSIFEAEEDSVIINSLW